MPDDKFIYLNLVEKFPGHTAISNINVFGVMQPLIIRLRAIAESIHLHFRPLTFAGIHRSIWQ